MSTIFPKSLRSSRSESRFFKEMERREYFFERDRVVVELGDEGEVVSPYFWEISWIARSMSSIFDKAGVDGRSEGVLDVVISSLRGFRFFFLCFDFFVGVDDEDFVFVAETGFSGTTVSSSSEWSASFN